MSGHKVLTSNFIRGWKTEGAHVNSASVGDESRLAPVGLLSGCCSSRNSIQG